MEILVLVAFIWLILKLFSKSSTKGEKIISQPSNRYLKCHQCGHDKFLDTKILDDTRIDEKGREFIQYHYRGSCAKCGSYLQEHSGRFY